MVTCSEVLRRYYHALAKIDGEESAKDKLKTKPSLLRAFLLPTSKNLIRSKKKLHKVAKSGIMYSTSKGEGPKNKKKEKTK